ncbi:SipW-dependent-type signal peptide-containing protein [Dietzia sp. PP-33]|uniref:SipW-dependent-type signal peptide-containing protein n=1 Tax=Dietzia sp. PP-33 TaxID=2957500 RepID=UPI0029A8F215|nr:SipW-dependent-type signal peptide-containing protein [Dietzia sp. PP-33]MDX2358914.1 SipW-dependent-type signal peptide-containing protein [Dietzia sp. PP-33]
MSTTSQTPRPAAQTQNRRKKVRAVMASGLVLGVGAAVTLAAWSDTAWGVSEFGTSDSAFNIQGHFNATQGWDEFLTKDKAGTMQFGPASTALVPGQPVFQLVGLHEEKGKLGADITVAQQSVASNALTDKVAVSVADLGGDTTPPATCSAEATGFQPVGTLAAPESSTTRVEKGAYKWLCLRAELASDAGLDAAGIAPAPVYWNFDAQSDDA